MAIHMNHNWPVYAQNFDKSTAGYRIKKSEEGYTHLVMSVTLNAVLMQQQAKVRALLAQNKGVNKSYAVKFDKVFTENVQQLIESSNMAIDLQEKDPLVQSMEVKTGLNAKEQRDANLKGMEIVRVALEKFAPIVKTEKDLDTWVAEGHRIYRDFFVANGSEVKTVRLAKKFSHIDVGKLSCISFVFLYLNDPEFVDSWNGDLQSNVLSNGIHHEALTDLEYHRVGVPNTGDLVLYIRDHLKDMAADLQHIGIFQENGRVLSKKGGIDDPCIYEHDINCVPANYGRLVCFYRKTTFK